MNKKKPVFVVSAPSGAGKTTLNRRLLANYHDIEMSVSFTARPKRPNEREGVDYHFISRKEFEQHIAAGDMLEYAEVFGTLYGTSIAEIRRINALNKTVILEIDVQGWEQARQRLKQATSIFILPPSIEALWQRLVNRATEPKDVQIKRLKAAREEINKGHLYDYFIINTDLDEAYAELENIIVHHQPGRIKDTEGKLLCNKLLREFDQFLLEKSREKDFA